jgi:hypothetical protein
MGPPLSDTTFDNSGFKKVRGRIVTHSLGRLRGETEFALTNPAGRPYVKRDVEQSFEQHGAYVDAFALNAFGLSLSLTDAANALTTLIAECNANAEQSLVPQLKKYADENGISHDEVFSARWWRFHRVRRA